MQFYFIDDSKISPHPHSRNGVGHLVAVGGVIVSAENVGPLEQELEAVCSKEEYSVPPGENLKWSPARGSWMREHLDGELRQKLFSEMIDTVRRAECKVVVAISDADCRVANSSVSTHEMDATILAFERFNTWLGSQYGTVIVSKPSGGARDENKFVSECTKHIASGTNYVDFRKLALKPLLMPARQSRLLQIADLAVSITNAHVSGGNPFADRHFPALLAMMPETSRGVRGGLGLKLHPSFRYLNLYHWLLNDDYYVKGSNGYPLPLADRPFATSAC